ncbi:MAG: basic amino acid ABC transporter substrate-binding protein [Firmicutes bacterium]|jgi:polar amino acid transport system substrate-binding protein|nr:basic amino acid ABC transporter substrate-binding protein [Bacillota bacterium]
MKKALAIVSLCIAFSLMLGATALGAAKPVLRVGTDATYPPFEFQDEKTGAYAGFDMDLIRAIGNAIDMDVQITSVQWDGIIPGLIAGNYDVIISAMTITDERLKAINFSDPYFTAGQVIVTLARDTSINTIDDLQGKKVAVQIGTTGDFAASEVRGATVKRFSTTPEAIQEVRNGGAAAAVIDLGVAAELAKEYKDIKYGSPFTLEYYGIAVRKKDTELLKKINRGLAAVKASGKYDEIFSKWFAGTN